MSSSAKAVSRPPPENQGEQDEGTGTRMYPGMDPMMFATLGMSWWKNWIKMWTALWGGGPMFMRPSGEGVRGRRGDRRATVELPWVPQLEATVIPLRRHTDPPGTEASKISMRVRVPAPWMGGADNVIAFDALVPRMSPAAGEEAEGGERGTTPSGKPETS